MRLLTTSLVALAALAACNDAEETPVAPAEETVAPAADEHAGHGAMTEDMTVADAADDANMAETADGFTFHTYPDKVESVHLPVVAGETWTATASDAALVSVGEATDETMPDGAMHHVVKVTPLASGNATVRFERRAAPDAAATDTRVINFMVH